MSQAVANAKQFAATTKGIPLRSVIPVPSQPPIKLTRSARKLREEKAAYKEKVKDAKSGKYDKVTGSGGPGTPNEVLYGDVIEPGPTKNVTGPEQEIYDAEVVEPAAITTGPRMITSERIQPTKAIEPSRQWSNG